MYIAEIVQGYWIIVTISVYLCVCVNYAFRASVLVSVGTSSIPADPAMLQPEIFKLPHTQDTQMKYEKNKRCSKMK